MRLRALTLNREMVYFDIKDVPILINDTMFILASKENSPILLCKSITRGLDNLDIFETDFVMSIDDKKVLGFIVYSDGFYIWHTNGTLEPLRDIKKYEFYPNEQMYLVREMESSRSRIRFGVGTRRFGIDRIIYYDGDEIYISIKQSGPSINRNSVNYGTGVNTDVKELLYGQVLNNGEVVMNNYHPMLKLKDGTIRELEVSDYD